MGLRGGRGVLSSIIQSQALSCASFSRLLWRKFSMNFAALQFVFFSTLLRYFCPLHCTPAHTHSHSLSTPTRLNSMRHGVQLQSSVETTTKTMRTLRTRLLLTVVNNKTASEKQGQGKEGRGGGGWHTRATLSITNLALITYSTLQRPCAGPISSSLARRPQGILVKANCRLLLIRSSLSSHFHLTPQ